MILLLNIAESERSFSHLNLIKKTNKTSSKVSQNLVLMIIGEKSTFEAPINYSNDLNTAVSVAFSIPSPVPSHRNYAAIKFQTKQN